MPLIIEDGTLPENANSYVTLAQADAYLVPRNLWPATEVEKPVEPEEPIEPVDPDNGEDNGQENEQRQYQNEPEGFYEYGIVPKFITEPFSNDGNDSGEFWIEGNNEDTDDKEESQEPEPELPDTSKPDENPDIAKKEAALMRAFDYLNGPLVWKGSKVGWQRMVAWPRENVPIPGCNPKKPEYIPNDIIPEAVCRAQMELAAYIYNGRDMFAPLERGGKYQSKSDSKSESVDVLSESESHSIAYSDNAPIEDWLPSIYPLLKPYLDEVPGELKSAFSVHDVLRG